MSAPAGLEAAFRDSRRYLWGMCYRMTGCAADADDLLQDTFARALERPPARTDMPWRPWLVRVAMNLGRDHLRRRRRRGYAGPWLPSPVEPAAVEAMVDGVSTEGRYDLLESVSLAFLVALEALTPQRRAVLLLRDVFDYSVAETAELLAMTQANVKTSLHRARRQMAGYDAERARRPDDPSEVTGRALAALFERLTAGDAAGVAALLADDVVALSDGGGEFHAARVPVVGRDRVARFLLGLLKLRGMPTRWHVAEVNGRPAVVAEFDHGREREAPRSVMAIDVDADGRVRRFYSVLARRKLTAVSPVAA